MRSFVNCVVLSFLALAAMSSQAQVKRIWGVNGHPDQVEYAQWDLAAVDRQLALLKELGADYYRIGYFVEENRHDPRMLDALVPKAMSMGIKVLPIVFEEPDTSRFNGKNEGEVFQLNYDAGYTAGRKWAEHAIARKYNIEYWEIGNETSLAKRPSDGKYYFSHSGEGVDKSQWKEEIGGALPAMAGVLRGLYWGIKNTYAKNNLTARILFGEHVRRFGYVRMIMDYAGANFFPGDILSWHWYYPGFRSFTAPMVDGNPATTPAAYAASFGKDIWITEIGREERVPPNFEVLGGSSSTLRSEDQNWMQQSNVLFAGLSEMISVPQVKAIFVYELYDESRRLNGASLSERVSQAFHGLVNFDGYRKDAFYMYRNFISNYPY